MATTSTLTPSIEDAIHAALTDPATMMLAVRAAYRAIPDPARILPEPFTLADLQRVHESILGESLMRDSFRRGMRKQLVPTGERTTGQVGKPAMLYRHP